MRRTHLVLLLVFFYSCAYTFAAETRILVLDRAFNPTNADPREVKLGLAFGTNSKILATAGAHVALLAFRFQSGWLEELHFGLEGAGFFTMRSEQSRFPLETVDGLIAVFTEAKAQRWTGQVRYTHLSAHLADGLPGVAAIPYSRELLSLRVGYLLLPSLHVYGGVHLLTHATPSASVPNLQVGATYFLPLKGTKLSPFASTDLQYRRDVDTNPTWTMQLGMSLKDYEERYRSMRFFYQYFTGNDFRGQFFPNSYTSHSLGIDIAI